MSADIITVRWLGCKDYQPCWQAMQTFTQNRDEATADEIWLLEHNPVFTQGQNGKPEHVLNPGDIPVVQTDRGGQVTYHGPGQLMVYTLVDLKRKKLNVRQLVSLLEQSVMDLLSDYNITSIARHEAPGVYVNNKKICSIGLRIRKGCSYHGIAFNVALNLEPFTRINPCGFAELQMIQFSELGGLNSTLATGRSLVKYLMKNLRYTSVNDQTNF
jgi:lipoyl(octanoyl) transferase